MLSHIKLL